LKPTTSPWLALCTALALAHCTLRPAGRQVLTPDELLPASGSGSGPGSGGGTTAGGSRTALGPLPAVVAVGPNDPTCSAFTPPRAHVLSPVDAQVPALLGQMTMAQKLVLLDGGEICPLFDCDFEGSGLPELGIPDFKMRDGPRGVHQLSGGKSSTWAVAEARAASFDLDLEYRVGRLQAKEMRAFKYDLSLAPTINVLRHPGWARAQETYGEDPVLSGLLGAAFVRGMQETIPACVKHFAANNTDDNRNTTIASMDEQTLRENYTRAFQIVVEQSDPACIMAAYNGVNGDWCAENAHLLTDILRTEWGWTGFVVSDWWATKNHGDVSLNAGLDLEMPDRRAFIQLPDALQAGKVKAARVDEAVTRILNARARFGQLEPAFAHNPLDPNIVLREEHRLLARETAEKGAILLKNDDILPLGDTAVVAGMGTAKIGKIVLLGPDTGVPNVQVNAALVASGLGDRGSSNTNPPYAISFLQGIKDRAKGVTVTASLNVADAAGADVVVIPITMAHEDEGEAFDGGQDRADLLLSGAHPKHWLAPPATLIAQASAVNPNVIVVLAFGSAVVEEPWMGKARAIVQTFYPGQEGGHALARLLFGDVNFSGKLPFTIARKSSDYPVFQNTTNTATFDYLHGYRKLDAEGTAPLHPFGHGLSYTTFAYGGLEVLCPEGVTATGRLNVQVQVHNTGKLAGDEIVQLYVGYPHTAARRPKKELKAFARVSLQPGETKTVPLQVAARDLAYWGPQGWVVEALEHTVLVGPSADPKALLSAPFTVK